MEKQENCCQHNSLVKIIAAVLFIALPFLGFYLGTQYQSLLLSEQEVITQPDFISRNKTNPTPVPLQIFSQIAEVTPTAEMSGWKTYKNFTNKFSFRYPTNVSVKEVHPGYVSLTRNKDQRNLDLVMLFFNSQNPDGLSRREFYAKEANSDINDIINHLNITEVSLGQVSALRIVEDSEFYKLSSLPHTRYMVANGNIMHKIITTEYYGKYNGNSTDLVTTESDLTTIKQILSTFRFE